MNYKELFHRIVSLLSAPAKAWEEISASDEGGRVTMGFVYPLIGVCGLADFIGTFVERGVSPDVFQYALQSCCAVAVALFGGFFMAVYLLDKIGRRGFSVAFPEEMLRILVGYSLVVTFVLDTVDAFFSITLLHWILQLYTLFVVFEGARRFLKVPETKLTSYTVVATVLVLLSPALIEFVFNKLSVILN